MKIPVPWGHAEEVICFGCPSLAVDLSQGLVEGMEEADRVVVLRLAILLQKFLVAIRCINNMPVSVLTLPQLYPPVVSFYSVFILKHIKEYPE